MSGRRRRWWSKEKKKIMVYPSRRCAVKEMVVMVGVCVWCHREPNTFPSPPHLLLSLAELAMNGFLVSGSIHPFWEALDACDCASRTHGVL
ncbi:hypothetical protein QJS10_CPA07g00722 [Acorus calamus]|uniref:Uncharacterized protein n=1 Tax=Acorus calamus TaxID=4465 RepID=A0AAV9EFN4_ACOCL|nr:hypothetical protein QJS10_CPA07g00722 [Acorus calamus]